MPRPIRAGGLSTLSLALSLSMSGALVGCGGAGGDEPAILGSETEVSPAEPGQTTIPEPVHDRDPDTSGLGTGTTDVPVADEPEAPGTGS